MCACRTDVRVSVGWQGGTEAGERAEASGELIPLGINVGDVVLYSKYGGTEVAVDGDDLLVLSGRDVLAIVEK